jgi:Leucine-rich repeat (LRR) protein
MPKTKYINKSQSLPLLLNPQLTDDSHSAKRSSSSPHLTYRAPYTPPVINTLSNEILLKIFLQVIQTQVTRKNSSLNSNWSIDIQSLSNIRDVCRRWKEIVDTGCVQHEWDIVTSIPVFQQLPLFLTQIKNIEENCDAYHYLWRFEKLSNQLGAKPFLFFKREYEDFLKANIAKGCVKPWQQMSSHLTFQNNIVPESEQAIRSFLQNELTEEQIQPISESNLSRLLLKCFSFPLEQFHALKKLDLSLNQLSELPMTMLSLKSLTWLSLNDNQLSASEVIWQLPQLTHLFVTKNKLTQLPSEIHCTQLQVLDLSENLLETFPTAILQLSTLRELRISNNQLTQLPDEIEQLQALQELNLASNLLKDVPSSLQRVNTLRSLSLSDNQLDHVSSSIYLCTNLTMLNLVGNQLTELPLEFTQLVHLQELYLNGNQIRMLPPDINRLTQLKAVNLQGNSIENVPETWGNILASRKKRRTKRHLLLTLHSEQ